MDSFNPQKVQISAKEFAAKYKSKYEVYRFMTVDSQFYLSPYNTVSIYFLRDLASGAKKRKYSRRDRPVVQISAPRTSNICTLPRSRA